MKKAVDIKYVTKKIVLPTLIISGFVAGAYVGGFASGIATRIVGGFVGIFASGFLSGFAISNALSRREQQPKYPRVKVNSPRAKE